MHTVTNCSTALIRQCGLEINPPLEEQASQKIAERHLSEKSGK